MFDYARLGYNNEDWIEPEPPVDWAVRFTGKLTRGGGRSSFEAFRNDPRKQPLPEEAPEYYREWPRGTFKQAPVPASGD